MKSLRNFFMVAALIAIPAFGQELTSDITGTVTNGAGTPVSGATVSVTYSNRYHCHKNNQCKWSL